MLGNMHWQKSVVIDGSDSLVQQKYANLYHKEVSVHRVELAERLGEVLRSKSDPYETRVCF